MTEPSGLRDSMSEQPSEDPFEDCDLSPDAILGTHTFEDVLFTDETETPVNVLTGETPAHSQATSTKLDPSPRKSTVTHRTSHSRRQSKHRSKHQASRTQLLPSSTSRRPGRSSDIVRTTPPTTRIRSQLSSRPITKPGTWRSALRRRAASRRSRTS